LTHYHSPNALAKGCAPVSFYIGRGYDNARRARNQAVLRGNRLEWSGEVPDRLTEDRPVRVSVTILETSASQGQRMATALEKLAHLEAASAIADPVAWEREQRAERHLPGRDS